MSETASISTGIAGRYASAIFELTQEQKSLDTLEKDVDALSAAVDESDDLKQLLTSPIYSRDQQEKAIGAVAEKMGLSATMTNTLRLMAQNRRLFVVPALIAQLREKIANAKGEITADVVAAKALTKAQSDKLVKVLKERFGSDIKLNSSVDESLIGGLVVKVGSKMIDTSIRSRLDALQNTMKEAR
ncbi:F0F1 ATP synthase subunit delta [Aestuariibius sp. 2305UL40-4]|uniref:F0F1 ATP synthase subunit delta n=1 Tax=Aestuariibius violaceus TaxID=3234132 RepID=UPI00345EEE7B